MRQKGLECGDHWLEAGGCGENGAEGIHVFGDAALGLGDHGRAATQGFNENVVGRGRGGEMEQAISLLVGLKEGVIWNVEFKTDVGEVSEAGGFVFWAEDVEAKV